MIERGGGESRLRPSGDRELGPCAGYIEIGYGCDMHSRGDADLGQEHGAKFAGADEADGDGTSFRLPLEKHAVQVHVTILFTLGGWRGLLRPIAEAL
jgi:hypothetical protein